MKTGVEHKTIDILGIAITPFTMEELLGVVDTSVASRQHLLIAVVNAAKIVNARKNAELMHGIRQANLVLADGVPVVWLSRMLGTPLPQRLAGIDIMYRILERASERRYRVYFLGAKMDIVRRVVDITAMQYPDLIVAGYKDGYFSDCQDNAVAQEIKESGADILFVAMPSPRKEKFLAKWYDFMRVPVCHGVGGSFDVMAGLTRRAPRWMQNCGLEWFYRLMQEPRRMWKRYLVTNTLFIGMSIGEIIRTALNRLRGISKVGASCSFKIDDK